MSELTPGRVSDLHETFVGGIRKVLWWAEDTDKAWVAVEDELGGNFSVDVPPPPANPIEFMTHIMLHAPSTEQRKLYASVEEDQHGRGTE